MRRDKACLVSTRIAMIVSG